MGPVLRLGCMQVHKGGELILPLLKQRLSTGKHLAAVFREVALLRNGKKSHNVCN